MAKYKEELVIKLSENFTKIISIDDIILTELYWGKNEVGDRFCNKIFNYEVIYKNGRTKKYSEDIDNDYITKEFINEFKKSNKYSKDTKGIIGIFIYSKKINNLGSRTIRPDISNYIKKQSCVCCGTFAEIICDHKNDLYNDPLVLNTKTQHISDFQALCNHCNLQKRQVCKNEKETKKIYSIKNIQQFKFITFEIPFEKKAYDLYDINTKKDTYWYDPIEFNKKLHLYMTYVLPIVNEIKSKQQFYHNIL